MSATNLRWEEKEKKLVTTTAQLMSIYNNKELQQQWANRSESSSSCLPSHLPAKVNLSWAARTKKHSELKNRIIWINLCSTGVNSLNRLMREYLTSWRDLVKCTRHGMVTNRCLREQVLHRRIQRLSRTCRRKLIRWLNTGPCSIMQRRWPMLIISNLWMSTCRRESQYLRTTSTAMQAFSGKRPKCKSFRRLLI